MNITRVQNQPNFRARIEKIQISGGAGCVYDYPTKEDISKFKQRCPKGFTIKDGDESFKIGDNILVKSGQNRYVGKLVAAGEGLPAFCETPGKGVMVREGRKLHAFWVGEIFNAEGLQKIIAAAKADLKQLKGTAKKV